MRLQVWKSSVYFLINSIVLFVFVGSVSVCCEVRHVFLKSLSSLCLLGLFQCVVRWDLSLNLKLLSSLGLLGLFQCVVRWDLCHWNRLPYVCWACFSVLWGDICVIEFEIIELLVFVGPVLTCCLLFCGRLPSVHPWLCAICARQVRVGPAQQPSPSLPSYLITLNIWSPWVFVWQSEIGVHQKFILEIKNAFFGKQSLESFYCRIFVLWAESTFFVFVFNKPDLLVVSEVEQLNKGMLFFIQYL